MRAAPTKSLSGNDMADALSGATLLASLQGDAKSIMDFGSSAPQASNSRSPSPALKNSLSL